MNKIITIIQPFVAKQTIYVYEDGIKIDAVQCNLINFNETILNLTRQYNTGNVEIIGPKQYTKGIGNKILEEEMAKYNTQTIEIKYK